MHSDIDARPLVAQISGVQVHDSCLLILLVLPSSSPAHMTVTFEQKLQAWRDLVADDAPDRQAPAQGSLL
jgi:G:T/U-mismatch repair DNA glycosylase